jgi:hypothetical protein
MRRAIDGRFRKSEMAGFGRTAGSLRGKKCSRLRVIHHAPGHDDVARLASCAKGSILPDPPGLTLASAAVLGAASPAQQRDAYYA